LPKFPTYWKLSLRASSRTKGSNSRTPQILRIMVLREIKRLSLRNVVKELYSNESYRKFCKISNKVPCIQTLSYRTSKMDYNALIQKVILLYELQTGHKPKDSAIDSTMIKPCQDYRAQLQRKNHKYTDKNASWTKTTKDKWEYGYKAQDLVTLGNISTGLPKSRRLDAVTY